MKGKFVTFLLCMLVLGSGVTSIDATPFKGTTIASLGDGHILHVGGFGPGNYSNIQDAVDNASPGDIVFVYDDSSPYKENVTISTSITIRGEKKETTIVDGSHRNGTSFHIIADNVTVMEFTIQNTGTAVYIAGPYLTSSHNIIIHTIILNAHVGIAMYYGSPTKSEFLPYGYNIIADNYIKNTTFYSIVIKDGRNNLIKGNTITENHGAGEAGYGFGIEVSGAFNNISYNNVSNNDRLGIIIGETYQTEIYRNTIANNGVYGLVIECGSRDRVILNNFIGNRRHAALDQQIKIMLLVFVGHHPILPSVWKGNYWDRPRQLPYVVRGFIGYIGVLAWPFYNQFGVLPTNFVRFDRTPAQAPYNISTAL